MDTFGRIEALGNNNKRILWDEAAHKYHFV